ncbi:MAG: YncE family protein [Terriglobia bacterium]
MLSCRRPPPLKPYIAYVVNYQSATLAAMNLADFHVVASLPVTPEPERVLVRPGARQLFVVSGFGKISVAAFPQLRNITTLDVGRSAKDLAFSPDGRTAYILDAVDHEVVFLDCAGGSGRAEENAIPKVTYRLRLGGALADLALSPDGKTLVAASANPDRLTFINAATRQPLGTVEVGQSPGPMVILPDSSKVFVADTGEEKISVADMDSRKLLSHLEIGTRPTALLLKPDGGEIFVLAAASSTLVIVDAFHDNVEQTFPLGRGPVAGVFRQDNSVLYVANSGDGSVLALDVQNRAVLCSPHVGLEPRALALTPDQQLLVVVDRAGSSLAVLHADPTSLSNDRSVLMTTVPIGASPIDVVVPDFFGPK